jgi:hypothetical protein
MILRTYDNINDFYSNAMIAINRQLGSKLRTLGVSIEELPELLETNQLARYQSNIVDGIILEMYEYKGIRLIEVEWSGAGIKQRDINKDEREIRINQMGT